MTTSCSQVGCGTCLPGHGARSKLPFGVPPQQAALWALLLGAACSGERYSRPEGPVPRYEPAPVLPWDAGAAPPELGARMLQPDPGALVARAPRLPVRSTIPAQGEPRHERHDSTNVSDD